MILDTIEHYTTYASLIPDFAEAFEFAMSLKDKSLGRYQQKNYYATVQQGTTTVPLSEGDFEAHKKYIDVQIVIDGSEVVEWEPIEHLKLSTGYNSETDVAFYQGKGQAFQAKAGMFFLMFPTDGHKPLRYIECPTDYKKIVLKLKVGD